MANSNKKQSDGLISKAFGVAKKLSSTGFELAQHVAPGSIAKLTQLPDADQIIDITKYEKAMPEQKKYDKPQQLFREQVPQVTQKLFGRHYSKFNNISSFISPDLNSKIADYFFDKLNDFVSDVSSVDHLLKEVGAKSLSELKQSPERADRIGQALENQNKLIAAIQGALSGATGVIGTAIDIPFSMGFALRSIYQEARAHGFELNCQSEQDIVEYVFKQVDLGSIAEKQTLLVAVRTLSNLLETQDTTQLQALLGSSNDFSVLKSWLTDQEGNFKWSWLNHIPQISILSKLTPIAGAGIGAIYSIKMVGDAHTKAREVFSGAQQYLLQHPNENIDIRDAYERGTTLLDHAALPLEQNKPNGLKDFDASSDSGQTIEVDQSAVQNDSISKITIEAKSNQDKIEDVSVGEGIKALADEHVEPVQSESTNVAPAKTEAVTKTPRKRRTTKKKDELTEAPSEDTKNQ